MKNILLIEDDPFICDIVQTKFEGTEYKIAITMTAAEGLSQLHKIVPDMLLLDLGLPDMNGMDLLKKIKSDPDMQNIPIIIFSNNDTADIQSQADELGADGFFMKDSIDIEKLINQIADILWEK